MVSACITPENRRHGINTFSNKSHAVNFSTEVMHNAELMGNTSWLSKNWNSELKNFCRDFVHTEKC